MEENSHPRKCKDGGIGSSMGFLPPLEDLIPLTQSLISPELASAFGIPPPHTPTTPTSTFTHTHTPTPNRSTNRRREEESSPATTTTRLEPLKLFPENHIPEIPRTRIDPVDSGSTPVSGCGGFDEESNSVSGGDENGLSSSTGRGGVKRPRLVWTPQLHKRFVDVIEHLGVEKAVPKTIMEMMNVEGLTRENVASHLQKYRLYLKRVERVASPAAADLSLGSNSRRGGGSSSNQMGGLYDCFGVVGNGYGGGQQIQPPVPSLQCNSLSLMPIQIPPAAPAGSPFLAEVGVRRIGYGGGGGSQLGLGVGIGIGGGSGGGGGGVSPQAGYCGLESGGFGTVFWNRQRG